MNMIWKRSLAAAMCAVCVLSFCACGKSGEDAESSFSGAAVTVGSNPPQPPVRSETTQAAEPDMTQAAPEQSAADGTGEQTAAAQMQRADMPTFTITGSAKAGDSTMDVTVNLEHNTGFQMVTVRLTYDAALTPVDDDGRTSYEDGKLARGGMSTCPYNPEQCVVGYVMISQETVSADGDLFTCSFHLPADAKTGDSYHFSLEIVDYNVGDTMQQAVGLPADITLA